MDKAHHFSRRAVVIQSQEGFIFLKQLREIRKLPQVGITMGKMYELVVETLRFLNALEPRIESLRLANSCGESTVIEKCQKSYINENPVSNGHDRARRQQDNLFPYRPALVLTDGVDLVQYNPSVSLGQHRRRTRASTILTS